MSIETVARIVLGMHILAGGVGLFVGPAAMATRKGGAWHRRWGQIYVGAMSAVAVTAVILTQIRPNPFLLLVALFSFYLSYSGWRVLVRHKQAKQTALTLGQRAGRIADYAVTLACATSGLLLMVLGTRLLMQARSFGLVYEVFGAVALLQSAGEIVTARMVAGNPNPGPVWLRSHIARMLGAYIATLTAFSAVNMHHFAPSVPLVITWLWPTVVVVPFIIYNQRRYSSRRAKSTA